MKSTSVSASQLPVVPRYHVSDAAVHQVMWLRGGYDRATITYTPAEWCVHRPSGGQGGSAMVDVRTNPTAKHKWLFLGGGVTSEKMLISL